MVTDDDIRHFVDEGYLVRRGLVGAEDVERCRSELPRFARGEYPVANPVDVAADATDEEATASVLAVHFPHWVSDTIRGVVHHPGVVETVAAVCSAHLAHTTPGAKCMQSMLFAKPPGYPGQAWHQDERFIPTRDRSLVGAWIALDDATVDNGCLWVLPGSHRSGQLLPVAPHGSDEFDSSDEAQGVDAAESVPVEVAAGDVVFFNGYLLHRSFRNRSDGFRRALVNHYCSLATRLPWMMDRGIDVGDEDYRKVEIVAGTDPGHRPVEAPTEATFLRPASGASVDVVRADARAPRS